MPCPNMRLAVQPGINERMSIFQPLSYMRLFPFLFSIHRDLNLTTDSPTPDAHVSAS